MQVPMLMTESAAGRVCRIREKGLTKAEFFTLDLWATVFECGADQVICAISFVCQFEFLAIIALSAVIIHLAMAMRAHFFCFPLLVRA